jgi:hypothetical protein
MVRLVTALGLALVLAGCGGSAAPKPAEAATPAPPPAVPATPKPPEPAKPPPAPVDATPIAVDLGKAEAGPEFKDRAEHFGYDDGEQRLFWWSNGTGWVKVKAPADGEYEIRVTASCTAAQNEYAKFKLHVDGQVAGEVTLMSEDAKEYKVSAKLAAGEHKLGLEFTNDAYKENEYDRNLYVNGVKLVRVK